MDTFTHSIYLKVADFLYKGFPPGSIAVYRDQSMPADLVERMLKNLTTGHFTGKVHTIGVQVDSISDSLSFAGESELWVSDCALIAVSPDRVAASIRNAKIHGAGTFFVIGPNSGNAASCLPERTEDHKSLILGPDWQGMVLPKHHLALHGSSRRIISGSTGLLCQSAHCFHQAASTSHALRIGFSCLCHTARGDIASLVAWLSENSSTRTVGVQINTSSCGKELLSAIRQTATRKPVVVLLPARHDDWGTQVDTVDAASEALTRCGAVVTHSSEDFFEILRTFQSPVKMQGSQLAVVSDAQDAAEEFCSLASRYGLRIPRFTSPHLQALSNLTLPVKPITNPILVTGHPDASKLNTLIRLLATIPSVHGVVCLFSNPAESLLENLEHLQKTIPIPLICVSANHAQRISTGLTARASIRSAACSLGALAARARLQHRKLSEDAVGIPPDPAVILSLRKQLQREIASRRYALDPALLPRILDSVGIACTEKHAVSIAKAEIVAEKIGFPVDAELRADGLVSPLRTYRLDSSAQLGKCIAAMEIQLAETCPGAGDRAIVLSAAQSSRSGREITVTLQPVGELGLGISVSSATRRSQPVLLPISKNIAEALSCAVLGSNAAVALLLRLSWLAASYPEVRSLQLRADPGAETAFALDVRGSVCPPELLCSPAFAFHPLPVCQKHAHTARGTLLIRSIRPEDRRGIEALVSRLSPESAYSRFHVSLSALSPDQSAAFSQYDPAREVALAAFADDGILRGIARAQFTGLPTRKPTAEFAVLVDDQWHRLGIASLLLTDLEQEMKRLSCRCLFGRILSSSVGMISLAQKLGFHYVSSDSESDTVLYAKDI